MGYILWNIELNKDEAKMISNVLQSNYIQFLYLSHNAVDVFYLPDSGEREKNKLHK